MEELRPDVLVVPECEQLDKVTQTLGAKPLNSVHWIGSNPNKGLGVYAFGDFSFEVHPAYNPDHRWIIPLRVSGPIEFTLIAVWTVQMEESKESRYVRPLLDALLSYETMMAKESAVWAGDFNASYRFDKPSRPNKFRDFVGQMQAAGLNSVYHWQQNCHHGDERVKTFYMHHKPEKGHHIDYIFARAEMLSRCRNLEFGAADAWLKRSDHVPLILDVMAQ